MQTPRYSFGSTLPELERDDRDRPAHRRLVAYALIVVFGATVVVVILLALGGQIANVVTNILATLK